jgi:hypothetical protein
MDPKGNDTGVMKMMLWEQERFKDVKILDMGENMNGGKSYEYFADLGRRYPGDNLQDRPWDYVMKADDDSFINIPQLLERLRAVTPKDDLYMVLRTRMLANLRVVEQIHSTWVRATYCHGI